MKKLTIGFVLVVGMFIGISSSNAQTSAMGTELIFTKTLNSGTEIFTEWIADRTPEDENTVFENMDRVDVTNPTPFQAPSNRYTLNLAEWNSNQAPTGIVVESIDNGTDVGVIEVSQISGSGATFGNTQSK